MIVSDVGISNTLDPSVNIEQTTKRIELTRRNSKIESETIAKQKLLRRIHSKEGCSTGDQVTEPELVNLLMVSCGVSFLSFYMDMDVGVYTNNGTF